MKTVSLTAKLASFGTTSAFLSVSIFSANLAFAKNTKDVGPQDPAWNLKVQKAIQPYIDADQNVGVTFASIRNGVETIQSFGKINLNSTQKPKNDTVFQIGSVTKTFTSVMLASLVNQNLVKLDDPISKFFPEVLEIQNTPVGAITLKQLSTHTSGLPRVPANLNPSDALNPYQDFSDAMMIEALKAPDLLAHVGPYPIQYSNMGAGLLGFILTRVTGLSYDQMVNKMVTGPLRMSDTGINLTPDQVARSAQGYDEAYSQIPFWGFGGNSLVGAGGIHSTISDMLLYLHANLDPDQTTEIGRAIEFSHQLEVQGSAQSVDIPASSNIGLGWILNQINGNEIVWHNGEVGGFNSYTGINKTTHAAIEMISNTANTDVQNCMAYLLVDQNCPAIVPELQIQDSELQKMIGKYELASMPGHFIEILRPAKFLAAKIDGSLSVRLHPVTSTQFTFSAGDVTDTLDFKIDSSGDINQLIVTDSGTANPANRVP